MNKSHSLKRYKLLYLTVVSLLLCFILSSCSKKETDIAGPNVLADNGLFIVNEGMFTFGNASLSYYNPLDGTLLNNVFYLTNHAPLGDVAQSICIQGTHAWIVINNSGIIYQIDRHNGLYKGKLEGFVSPRNLLFVTDHKAYVSDLYSTFLTVVDPNGTEYIGRIELGRTSEEMVLAAGKVFVANWSALNQSLSNNMVMVVDAGSDMVLDSIRVGIEPNSMKVDKDAKLWVLCSGGYNSDENPSLWKIDPITLEVEGSFNFSNKQMNPVDLSINGNRDTLYFLNEGVYRMSIYDELLPQAAFIVGGSHNYYSLTVDDQLNNIYVTDALNYMVNGKVFRYSHQGSLMDSFEAGIIPGSFVFNR